MPTAPVDEKGTVFYYEDSGIPFAQSSTYTTIVLVHGAMFHCGIFKHLFPFAADNSLRLVALNLRDYPGSTPFRAEEIDVLRGSDKTAKAAFMVARGVELAAFLRWFIETEKIPPIRPASKSDGTRSGGLSLLGWSAGNLITQALLGNAEKLSAETRNLLGSYFRSIIIYDQPHTPLGIPPLAAVDHPFHSHLVRDEDRPALFGTWVSSYYQVPSVEPGSPDFVPALLACRPMHKVSDNARFTPTVERIPPDELATITDFSVMMRSQNLLINLDADIYAANFRRALFECPVDETNASGEIMWPAVDAQVVYCDMSVHDCLFAAHSFINIRKGYRGSSHKGREANVFRLTDANHFVHWDEPERFVSFLAEHNIDTRAPYTHSTVTAKL